MSKTAIHIEKQIILVPELRFKEFHGKWEKKKFGDVLSITSAARVHKDEWSETGVPFFRSSDVVSTFNATENTKAFIPFELYESLTKKIGRVKKDDLLVTGGGSIGVPYLIKNDDPLYFKDADLLWIKTPNDISGYFLYSYLTTPLFRKYLNSISHIGTIAHYTVIQAKNTPCKFPSLPEQQKIASFLNAVDQKIQQLTRKKELLEQYKKGVMQQIFSQQIRFKDENGKEFPEWEEKSFVSVAKFINGKAFKQEELLSSGKYAVLRVGNLFSNNEWYYSDLELDEDKYIEDGDLIYAWSATFGPRFWIGEKTIYHYHIWKVVPNKQVDKTFLYHAFMFDVDKIKSQSQGGTMVHITKGNIEQRKFLFPSLTEQKLIGQYLNQINFKIDLAIEQLTQTQTFKKGLLQKMFVAAYYE